MLPTVEILGPFSCPYLTCHGKLGKGVGEEGQGVSTPFSKVLGSYAIGPSPWKLDPKLVSARTISLLEDPAMPKRLCFKKAAFSQPFQAHLASAQDGMSKHMEGKGLIQVVLSTLHPTFGGTLEHLMGEQLETQNSKPGAWQLELRRRADRRRSLKFREPFVVSEGNR